MSEKVGTVIDQKRGISQYQSLNWSIFSSLKLNIKMFLPKFCKCLCCKETTRDRIFNRSFKKFRSEIEITSLLKTLRVLKANTKKNFSQIQWRIYKLQKGMRKTHLVPDDDKQVAINSFKEHKVSPKEQTKQEYV